MLRGRCSSSSLDRLAKTHVLRARSGARDRFSVPLWNPCSDVKDRVGSAVRSLDELAAPAIATRWTQAIAGSRAGRDLRRGNKEDGHGQ